MGPQGAGAGSPAKGRAGMGRVGEEWGAPSPERTEGAGVRSGPRGRPGVDGRAAMSGDPCPPLRRPPKAGPQAGLDRSVRGPLLLSLVPLDRGRGRWADPERRDPPPGAGWNRPGQDDRPPAPCSPWPRVGPRRAGLGGARRDPRAVQVQAGGAGDPPVPPFVPLAEGPAGGGAGRGGRVRRGPKRPRPALASARSEAREEGWRACALRRGPGPGPDPESRSPKPAGRRGEEGRREERREARPVLSRPAAGRQGPAVRPSVLLSRVLGRRAR